MAMSALLMIVACEKDDKNTMIVEGNIEGLKMGTIYLQQYVNDKLTNIDSVVANGDGKFTFKRHLESPEVFYIYLDLKKQAGTDLGDRLMFFGEPTTININSAWGKSQYQWLSITKGIQWIPTHYATIWDA